MKRTLTILCVCLLVALSFYCYWFYPKQMVEADSVVQIEVVTPNEELYHNDCLHPCVRAANTEFAGFKYWMAQSPYYCWNNKVENPILYHSNDLRLIASEWGGGGN